MSEVILYTIISVLIVSVVAILAALPFLLKKKVPERVLLFMLSISVGVLLAAVFLDFLPEVFSHSYRLGDALFILTGFLVLFVVEGLVHWHHSKTHHKHHHAHGHGHAYSLAPVNLIGDAVHNLIDGLVIAGSYAVSIPLGIAATISVIFHEVPQEVADIGVLLYSGLSRTKALLFNLLSAITAFIGAIIGLILVGKLQGFTAFIIPFAAGNFLYIAASNLLPQLHKHCSVKDIAFHLFAIILGIVIIVLITLYGPAHVHG